MKLAYKAEPYIPLTFWIITVTLMAAMQVIVRNSLHPLRWFDGVIISMAVYMPCYVVPALLARVREKGPGYVVNMTAQGIEKRGKGEQGTRPFFRWKDVYQVKLVKTPIRPGVFQDFGKLVIACKAPTNAQDAVNMQEMEILLKTEDDYRRVRDFAKPYWPYDRWIIEQEETAGRSEIEEKKPDVGGELVKYWAFGKHGVFFWITLVLGGLYLMLGLKLVAFNPEISALGWILIFIVLLPFCVERIGVYYRLSESGIVKYYLLGIPVKRTRWEDIAEAGFTNLHAVYLSTTTQNRRLFEDKPYLAFRKGIVAHSMGANPKMAAAFAKYVPAEKWVR